MNRKSLMISTMLMSAMGVGGVVGNVWSADKHWHLKKSLKYSTVLEVRPVIEF